MCPHIHRALKRYPRPDGLEGSLWEGLGLDEPVRAGSSEKDWCPCQIGEGASPPTPALPALGLVQTEGGHTGPGRVPATHWVCEHLALGDRWAVG